jgi:hypothetical protein
VPDDSTAVDSPQGGSGGSPASFPSGSAADAVAAADLQDSLLDLGYTEVTLEIIDTPRYERYEISVRNMKVPLSIYNMKVPLSIYNMKVPLSI